MNIKIKDKWIFESLMDSALVKVNVGSHLYNMITDNSDKDILIVYAKPRLNENSYLWDHHQIQYDAEGVNYIFTDLQNFIRNILTGDSTINFEAIHTKAFLDSKLFFLYQNRKSFRNYNIIKSYLGMVKRDIKRVENRSKSFLSTAYSNPSSEPAKITSKDMYHIYRGLVFSDLCIMNQFSIDLKNMGGDFYSYCYDLKKGEYLSHKYSLYDFLDLCKDKMNTNRKKLNQMLEKKEINRFGDVMFLSNLDEKIMNFCDSNYYRHKQIENSLVIDKIYEALENGIKY
jgi:hypothetical protein